MTYELDGTGIWSAPLRYGDPAASADAAAELEELGYRSLWVPDVGGDLFAAVDNLLAATTTATVATGILNLWMHSPAETAEHFTRLTATHGARFLVGIGVSHAVLVDSLRPEAYQRPLTRLREYLDGLDAERSGVPVDRRVLAALGPKALELARTRACGTHQYLVLPEHTARAREALGPDALVAPEVGVVLETDPTVARTIARQHLAGYIGLPNYSNNWRRAGFEDDDLAGGGSDRLVDALVAWGDEATIRARVDEHRSAGADHVCIQVLTDDLMRHPREQWRRLAAALVT